MLEESPKSTGPTQPIELEPFGIDPVFQSLSYCRRYEEVCTRLVRERLYDAACFFTSSATAGKKGQFSQPSSELGIRNFAIALASRARAVARSATATPER